MVRFEDYRLKGWITWPLAAWWTYLPPSPLPFPLPCHDRAESKRDRSATTPGWTFQYTYFRSFSILSKVLSSFIRQVLRRYSYLQCFRRYVYALSSNQHSPLWRQPPTSDHQEMSNAAWKKTPRTIRSQSERVVSSVPGLSWYLSTLTRSFS